MLKVQVEVTEARRPHYTDADLYALQMTLKPGSEKALLLADLIAERQEHKTTRGTLAERQAERNLARDEVKSLSDQCSDLTDKNLEYMNARDNAEQERDKARAEFCEIVGQHLQLLLQGFSLRAAAKQALEAAEGFKAQRDEFATRCDELAQNLIDMTDHASAFKAERDEAREIAAYFFNESIRYMFAHNLVSGERNQWIKRCAQLELEKLVAECERDHAREVAIDYMHKVAMPNVIMIPFDGEIDFSALPEVLADDEAPQSGREPYEVPGAAEATAQVSARLDAAAVAHANTGKDGGAAHYDSGKLSYNNVPEEGERALVEVFSYGERKYGFRNWEKTPGLTALQYFGSMRRHLAQWRASEDNDQESGLPHLAHVAANALMCLVTLRNDPASDNRKRPQ